MNAVGGQAVIEGVMMRNGNKVSVAVRKGKKIIVKKQKIKSITARKPWKYPLFRGVAVLFESLSTGIKTLNWSAQIAAGEDEKDESAWAFIIAAIIATAFALVIFKLIPLGIAQFLSKFGLDSRISFNLVEGIAKIVILVAYIWAIGRMKDVKRLFQYHGAEHKAVNCYEAKKSLTVANAMKFSPIHPRCGSSFILFVLLISIAVYIFVPMNFSFGLKYLLRIALLPLIAGIAYEVLKLSAKYQKNLLVRVLMKPGLALQGLTTKEPDKKQMEVSIKALKAVLK
ncbi:MAG: DUF1385 domain-containing protein [Candidatus Nanoarchaeia archaeon]|nr:DUF1385 domain-containing protein [Candidatus Nanoarchaeia archaeon]